ncbi:MAG: hypothetical protein NTU61_00330 [Candidatus Altiarchaeota archaeon]|nr:hypothetical protein [Candidatus Altiarchaeota archaeon]
MKRTLLTLLIVLVVLVCGCEFLEEVDEIVRDQAKSAIQNNDPNICYSLNLQSDVDWCLNKYSSTLNNTAGCKMMENKTYSKECIKNVALTTGNWSYCDDLTDFAENLACMAEVATVNIIQENTENKTAETTTTLQPLAKNISVEGSSDFTSKTNNALNLLQNSSEYPIIAAHIGKIKEYDRSGMNVSGNVPTFQVGSQTWNSYTMWYAGAIAHDSYHSKLYSDAKQANGGMEPNPNTWSGKAAEQKCLAFQIKVLQQIGADEDTINQVRQELQNPTYQDIPYENRTW